MKNVCSHLLGLLNKYKIRCSIFISSFYFILLKTRVLCRSVTLSSKFHISLCCIFPLRCGTTEEKSAVYRSKNRAWKNKFFNAYIMLCFNKRFNFSSKLYTLFEIHYQQMYREWQLMSKQTKFYICIPLKKSRNIKIWCVLDAMKRFLTLALDREHIEWAYIFQLYGIPREKEKKGDTSVATYDVCKR